MERRAIDVHGTVQGVGFRPFVYSLAQRYGLCGFVRNNFGRVEIEIEGTAGDLDRFANDLRFEAPPLALITNVYSQQLPARGGPRFSIFPSGPSNRLERHETSCEIKISPDVAPCAACIRELFDPLDRRYRYPFINCTNCGPRLTIIRGAPYDRVRTTMAGFTMCWQCRSEYEDPGNRRFHAEPICCPACGPPLELYTAGGVRIETNDPLLTFALRIQNGGIGALKGLGGYHLVCDARNGRAVSELRQRKQRAEKPFAVMVGDVAAVAAICEVSHEERRLVESRRRPIVLLRKLSTLSDAVCREVAPGNPLLGVMLPYTPLHLLLCKAVGTTLVMTSGNCRDEPIAYRDVDVFEHLGAMADIFLCHNRPIQTRCDDSVTRLVAGVELPARRSRGYAPQSIHLPVDCEHPILAVGGHSKVTFALGLGSDATLSQHMGDLDHFEAYHQFERDITAYEKLFHASPQVIAHDEHPEYASTRYAIERAARGGLRTVAVQPHHAHMASCMAENGLMEPLIAVAFDGTGFGIDEATGQPSVWGGEFLIGDYRHFRRAARLRYVAMPGGEKAVKEPWRMALAHLLDAQCGLNLLENRLPRSQRKAVQTMLSRQFNAPLTSSVGRLFDAVASMIGTRDINSYDGQAATELEGLAEQATSNGSYPFDLQFPDRPELPAEIDTRPLIRAIAADVHRGATPSRIARRFHGTLLAIVLSTCEKLANRAALRIVVLTGGVLMNNWLTSELNRTLSQAGFRVCRHRLVPPNDGGLCLGQLAVAAARWETGKRAGAIQRAQRCNTPA